MKITTCVYIEKNDHYLMLLRNKKENDINEGKWIGIGGHKEKNESIYECAIREVKEETNLNLNSLILKGEIHYLGEMNELMYIFKSNSFDGELKECDEGTLKWIKKEEIFNLNLWEGDIYFLKQLDNEKYINLTLIYEKIDFNQFKLTKVIDNDITDK